MIEQTGNAVKFAAFFSASKTGKTGLTVTVDVYNPAGSLVVTAGSASAVGGGLYAYTLASGSVTAEGEYYALFKTSDSTVDQQHIPALWCIGHAGIEDLDAAVSSRNATAPPAASAIATATRTELAAELGRMDVTVSSRNATTPPAASAVATATRAELAAELARIDAAVSTRNATAPDNAGIAAIKAKTDALPASPAATGAAMALTVAYDAAKTAATQASVNAIPLNPLLTADTRLANLDATVSSRNATAPPSASAVATATRAELSAELGRIDVAVSTRNATTPPAVSAIQAGLATAAAVAAIPTNPLLASDTRLNHLDANVSAAGGGTPPTVAEIAAGIMDADMAGHTLAGSPAAAWRGAQAAGDPMDVILPGAYPPHSAGAIIAKLDIDAPSVVPAPGPPPEPGYCMVWMDTARLTGERRAGVRMVATLSASPAKAGGWSLERGSAAAESDADGRIVMVLPRNSAVVPAGTSYRFGIQELGFSAAGVVLEADTFDLGILVV